MGTMTQDDVHIFKMILERVNSKWYPQGVPIGQSVTTKGTASRSAWNMDKRLWSGVYCAKNN